MSNNKHNEKDAEAVSSSASQPTEEKICEYKRMFKRIDGLALLAQACIILALLMFIFLPIYSKRVPATEQYPYISIAQRYVAYEKWDEIKSIFSDEIVELAEDASLLSGGMVNVNFSLFDELKAMAKAIMDENSAELVPLFTVLLSLLTIVELVLIFKIAIPAVMMLHESLKRLKYNGAVTRAEIRRLQKSKTPSPQKKKSKVKVFIAFFAVMILDVVFVKIIYNLLGTLSLKPSRGMISLSGISPLVIIPVLLVIGFFVLEYMHEKSRMEFETEILDIKANEDKNDD